MTKEELLQDELDAEKRAHAAHHQAENEAVAKLRELTAILGDDPVGKAKALAADRALLENVTRGLGYLVTALDDESGRKLVLDDAFGVRPAMIEARRERDKAQQSIDFWFCETFAENQSGAFGKVWAKAQKLAEELAALRDEVEGDNGLRASKEAGWAIAKARLETNESLRAALAASESAQATEQAAVIETARQGREAADALKAETARLQARVAEADSLLEEASRADLETERAVWVERLGEYERRWA